MNIKEKLSNFQEKLEKNIWGFMPMLLLVLSIGGIVEIVPLFYIDSTIEKLSQEEDSIRPYTALELEGRDIYLREGCFLCHSQMVRPFRDEKERYGHYSLAAESKFDHPFQWGSKRTGPDLARVGGKYSDDWHRRHLIDPQAMVPGSVMPKYAFLEKEPLDPSLVVRKMKALSSVGVPYTEEDMQNAEDELKNKTELDALVAYLQMLGTLVSFEEGKDYRE